MSNYKIEKGIPVPEYKYGAKRKYPWEEMEVGDSFFTPINSRNGGLTVYANKRYPGKKFTARKVEGGIRVWRIE